MTEAEVRAQFEALEGAHVIVGSAELGTPEAGIGDTFCSYDPGDGIEPQKIPFATIVTSDTPGWDEVSDLDRDGTFRVNLGVGREHVPDHTAPVDHAQQDVVLPHPQYAAQGWVCIVNPGPATDAELVRLLSVAHRRAIARHR